ncbi:hypothetical protein [Mumia zhuanghuii]|nr:hypothetical protein [Mumia zhuanghuii]
MRWAEKVGLLLRMLRHHRDVGLRETQALMQLVWLEPGLLLPTQA